MKKTNVTDMITNYDIINYYIVCFKISTFFTLDTAGVFKPQNLMTGDDVFKQRII